MDGMWWNLVLAPPRLVLGSVVCCFVALCLLWRLLRKVACGPRSARALLVPLLLSIGFGGLGAGGIKLGVHLSGYTAISERARVLEVQCVARSPKRLRLYLDPFLADGSRGPTATHDLDGDEWLIGGEVLRFRPFLSKLGLKTYFRISRISGLSEDRIPKRGIAWDRASALSTLLHHLLSRWLFDRQEQVFYQRPDPRAVFEISVEREGCAINKRVR
jgi:hypothetical protein